MALCESPPERLAVLVSVNGAAWRILPGEASIGLSIVNDAGGLKRTHAAFVLPPPRAADAVILKASLVLRLLRNEPPVVPKIVVLRRAPRSLKDPWPPAEEEAWPVLDRHHLSVERPPLELEFDLTGLYWTDPARNTLLLGLASPIAGAVVFAGTDGGVAGPRLRIFSLPPGAAAKAVRLEVGPWSETAVAILAPKALCVQNLGPGLAWVARPDAAGPFHTILRPLCARGCAVFAGAPGSPVPLAVRAGPEPSALRLVPVESDDDPASHGGSEER